MEKKKNSLEANQNASRDIKIKDYLPSAGGGRGGRGGRRGGRGGRGGSGGRVQRGPTPKQIDKAEIQFAKDLEKYSKVDKDVLKRLRDALDAAVKIATKFNIQPIPGVTVVLCCVSDALDVPCTAFKGMGTPRTVKEVSYLLKILKQISYALCCRLDYCWG